MAELLYITCPQDSDGRHDFDSYVVNEVVEFIRKNGGNPPDILILNPEACSFFGIENLEHHLQTSEIDIKIRIITSENVKTYERIYCASQIKTPSEYKLTKSYFKRRD
jgi:hypothetical protein